MGREGGTGALVHALIRRTRRAHAVLDVHLLSSVLGSSPGDFESRVVTEARLDLRALFDTVVRWVDPVVREERRPCGWFLHPGEGTTGVYGIDWFGHGPVDHGAG